MVPHGGVRAPQSVKNIKQLNIVSEPSSSGGKWRRGETIVFIEPSKSRSALTKNMESGMSLCDSAKRSGTLEAFVFLHLGKW